jgi:hypothetical protein
MKGVAEVRLSQASLRPAFTVAGPAGFGDAGGPLGFLGGAPQRLVRQAVSRGTMRPLPSSRAIP